MIEEDNTEFFDKLTDNVKDERKKRKISQLKLSNILGHNSTSYVARIELREGVNYNLSHLLKIAQEFDIDIKDLEQIILMLRVYTKKQLGFICES